MRAASFRTAVWILVALAAACGAGKRATARADLTVDPREYDEVREAWTRSTDAYALSGLDNLLTATATFRSWEFRRAYAARYVDDHRLSGERAAAVFAEERRAHAAATEFFVAAYTGQRRSADFGTTESAWRVTLVTSDRLRVEPKEIRRLDRPTASERAYYPFASVYRQAFLFQFPRQSNGRTIVTDATEWIELSFDGALGHARMRWQLR